MVEIPVEKIIFSLKSVLVNDGMRKIFGFLLYMINWLGNHHCSFLLVQESYLFLKICLNDPEG